MDSAPAPLLEPHNAHLLPTSKTDIAKTPHLASLDPSNWTHPILYNTSTPPSKHQPFQPAIGRASGLLTWIQDVNWPICGPTTQLLLTILNGSPETRETHGIILVNAMKRLFRESEDWEWISNLFLTVVSGIEDKAWAREVFSDVLREFEERVPEEAEKDYEFEEWIREYAGDGLEEEGKGQQGGIDASK